MSNKISVTPNVEYSLKILEKAVKEIPEVETKENAKGAIQYLLKAAQGEKQPGKGQNCPTPVRVFPPG